MVISFQKFKEKTDKQISRYCILSLKKKQKTGPFDKVLQESRKCQNRTFIDSNRHENKDWNNFKIVKYIMTS